jgi:hypothetical protein
MEVTHWSVRNRDEIRDLFSIAGVVQQPTVNEQDNSDDDAFDPIVATLSKVIIIGLGDNTVNLGLKRLKYLSDVHDAGKPILFMHGSPNVTYNIDDDLDNKLRPIVDSLGAGTTLQAKLFINFYQNNIVEIPSVFSTYLNNLGVVGFENLDNYHYFNNVSVVNNHALLTNPYPLTGWDHSVQMTHLMGVRLVPEAQILLNNSSIPNSDYNYYLAIYETAGKGKIAFMQLGHNNFDENDTWHSVSIRESRLFYNVLDWLTS